jgi:PEP-CTERM motif
MKTELIVTAAVLLGLAAPAHAQLFTPNSGFTVTSGGTPGVGGADDATLTPGTTMTLTNAGLTLKVSMVAGTDRPGSEWLVFQYTSEGPISPSQGNWTINPVGLLANQPLFLIRGFDQFDVNGTEQAFNFSPFGGFTPVAAPTSDLASILSGPGLLSGVNMDTNPADAFPAGPLPSLGTFINPFSQLNGDLVNEGTAGQITSYTDALEFTPANFAPGTPEPSTWAMMLLGFGGIGFMGWRGSRKAAAHAA